MILLPYFKQISFILCGHTQGHDRMRMHAVGRDKIPADCIHVYRHECVCVPACMYVAYFSIFYNLLMNAVSIHQLIERMVEIHMQLYIHLCMHEIPHLFDHCDCFVFRLYAKSLSTHWPNLAYCAIFLNKLVKLVKHFSPLDIIASKLLTDQFHFSSLLLHPWSIHILRVHIIFIFADIMVLLPDCLQITFILTHEMVLLPSCLQISFFLSHLMKILPNCYIYQLPRILTALLHVA